MASPAFAGPISAADAQISISATDGEWGWTTSPSAELDSDGNFVLDVGDRGSELSRFITTDIMVSGNVDPVISASFNVTNNTLVTQDYTFIFTLPIIAQTPFTVTGGSTGITATDNNGGGATVGAHSNGRPTYFSQIDGADFTSLTLTPIVAGGFLSNTNSGNFGVPIPSFPGPAALATIGIRYDFSLTAGDSAGVTGVFVVEAGEEAIPEPASITLMGFAVLLVTAVYRRKMA